MAGLTLEDYARAKRLPKDFLEAIGLSTIYLSKRPVVKIPYFGVDGSELASRFRQCLAKGKHNVSRFVWRKGSKPCPYGLWMLKNAVAKGYVVLVEGESDAQTLWYHEIPALGLPGADSWQETWAEYLEGIETIYVIVEPDQGGEGVLRWLAKSSVRARAKIVRLPGVKDPSELYLRDPEAFLDSWQAAIDTAVAWRYLEQMETDKEIARCYDAARDLLLDPNIVERVAKAIRLRGYAGDVRPALIAYVALTSRLLRRPMNIAFVALSGAGKNTAIDRALEFVPPEAVYIMKAGSPRALIYTDEEFTHRTVVFGEADSIPEEGPAASAIRSLAEDSYMAYDVTERDERTGRQQTRHIEKLGPTGLITTSTRSLGPQMSTRVLEVNLPDDERQTRAVMSAHASNVLPGSRPTIDLEPFLALQRYLAAAGEHEVAVPFAQTLAQMLPARNVRMRRDFRQVLTCIQTIALLRQCQRNRTSEGWIEATL
ncbi:MAG: hypothetical protein ACYC1C_18490, partial [Chloroflexota bacterium]